MADGQGEPASEGGGKDFGASRIPGGEDPAAKFSRKTFALVVVVILVLTAFAIISRPARADTSTTSATSPITSTQGPGTNVTVLADGSVKVSRMANFRRWDGAWLPMAALNFSAGNWPYRLNANGTSFTVSVGSMQFTQGEIAGATYQFLPDRVKETLRINASFPTPVTVPAISAAFATTYLSATNGASMSLYDYSGASAWTTSPFEAWDSSAAVQKWGNAVTSIQPATGGLSLVLNTTVLSQAVYPLYIDPTWTIGGGVGWGASTFQNATVDGGDGSVKIGWLADNFNDNTNELWTTSGVTFSGGTMNLANGATAFHDDSWSNLNGQFDVYFSPYGSGSDWLDFYVGEACQSGCTAYDVRVLQNSNTVQLIDAGGTNFASFSVTIATGTWYTVRLAAEGTTYQVWWNGALKVTASDTYGRATAGVEFHATTPSSVSVDNVRIWNTNVGSITTPVRDAGTNRPLQTEVFGTIDSFNQTHIQIRSSANNAAWGPWTNLKANAAPAILYSATDQDRQEYYRLQIVLTSGANATPVLTQITTIEGTPTTSPAANTGMEAWYPYAGGLANLVNGNFYASAADLSFQAKGFGLGVARSYDSLLYTQAGPFGPGWTFSYGQSLTVNGNGNVTWNGPDGSQFLFVTKGANGGFDSPRGVAVRFIKNADGTFTLATTDGGSEHFSSAGLLQSIADRNGNALTLAYSTGTPPLLLSVTDGAGKALSFAYDGNNHVVAVSDPAHRSFTYGYNGNGQLTSVTDPLGNKWQYTYVSASGPIQQVIDPVGKSVLVGYVTGGQTSYVTMQDVNTTTLAVLWQFRAFTITYNSTTSRAVQNARGYWTNLTLNSFGNPTYLKGPSLGCSCDAGGNSTAYTWDGEMNRIARTDGRGNRWSTAYGVRGNVINNTDPGGNVSSATWLEANNATNYFVVPASFTTARGFTSTEAYDGKGNLVATADPGQNTTRFGYDASGFLNKTVSARNSAFVTWFVFNASGWLVKKTDPMNDVTQYGYDGLGRQTTVTDPMGLVTTTTYDTDGHVTKVTDPLGNFTTYSYDGRGDVLTVTDPDAFTTTYTVNVTNGKDATVKDSGGNTTTYAYDLRGNLASVKDAKLHTTGYTYDVIDRLVKVTTPLGYVTTYVYDAASDRISRTDGNAHTTRYAYDKLDRLDATMYPGPPVYASPQTLTYAFDKDGNLVSATGFGYTQTFVYDRQGRLSISYFQFGGNSWSNLSYTYDQDGNRKTMTLFDKSPSSTTSYFYDAADRLTGILDGSLNTTFAYDRDSRQVKMTQPNGVYQASVYDNASRLLAKYTNKTGSTIESITYTYDKAGYVLSERDVTGSTTTTTFVYDKVHRQYKTVRGATTTIDTYDAVGDVATERISSTETFTYDVDNELTKASFSSSNWITYTYDKDGNRIAYQTSLGDTGTWSYDYENRLISLSGGCSYTYAPTGERVTDSCASAPTMRYDDGTKGGVRNLVADYSSLNARQDRYVHANAVDSPVEMVSGSTYYGYEADALGSVNRLTDISGNSPETYTYDPWGATTASGSVHNPLQFTARILDTSGDYDYRARAYDPTASGGHRFLTPDSIGVDSYTYVRDSPANFVDPTGHNPAATSNCDENPLSFFCNPYGPFLVFGLGVTIFAFVSGCFEPPDLGQLIADNGIADIIDKYFSMLGGDSLLPDIKSFIGPVQDQERSGEMEVMLALYTLMNSACPGLIMRGPSGFSVVIM